MINDLIAAQDSYEYLNREIKTTMRRSASDAVLLGYLLRRMYDEQLWIQRYDCLDEYLQNELHMDYSMATRFMNINKKYSVDGNSKEIADDWTGFSQSVLIEMLSMPPELAAMVTPDMTARQVREIKRQAARKKEREKIAASQSFPEPVEQETELQTMGPAEPDERIVQYLVDFAAYFVSLFFEWFQSDPRSRAMDLGLIPGEIRLFLQPYQRDWRFNSGDEEACIRIFDDHVRLCDGEGVFLGDYDWFYLASAINRAYLELKARKDVQGLQEVQELESEEEPMQDEIPDAEFREVKLQEEVATSQLPELVKPDKKQSQYLDDFAKRFIRFKKDWLLADFENRVSDVTKSPEEIREHLGEDGRTWYFSSGKDKVARIDMLDGYVQLWDGKGNHMGDFDWFYLAASIQRMWNVVALEMSNRPAGMEPGDARCGRGCGPQDTAQKETGAVGEVLVGLDSRITDELAEVKRILDKEQKLLDDCLEASEEDKRVLESPMFKRQTVIVAALDEMVRRMEKSEAEPVSEKSEQPPLPLLKNNDQRKEWLREYKAWGLWYRDENIGVEYYKYDFDNGARLIAEVYHESATQFLEAHESCYLHLVGGPEAPKGNYGIGKWARHERYSKYPNSESELVEFLKGMQKGGNG